ncbi:uncharacterized protein LOC129910849 [Episyrphus balteatus]|uniref:uncharacterized protein LOC129910849 n=1 Tax=Episyrphus balteatus TaxID=286459 RepID=UPI00248562D1|nr:uncharacterized protein LOC129910849 [Episyrphus balteatus]
MDNLTESNFDFGENQKTKAISPRRQRAMQFLQSLSKRLGRRVQNDLIYNSQEDLRSSSTDSFSLSLDQTEKSLRSSSIDFQSIGSIESNCHSDKSELETEEESNSSETTPARTPLGRIHLNRISISSVGKVLQSLSSSSRSLSCNSTPLKSQNKKPSSKPAEQKQQPQQQRILRQPVNYVYLKGMSGLPTRRVPRSSLCCTYAYR